MSKTEIYNNLKSVPEWAKKKIGFGALKGKTDISPQWRIQAMTEQFGAIGIGWYYKTVNKWLEKGHGNNVCAFVDIELFVKVDGDWSMPITGHGGNSFLSENKNGVHTSDECYKMATTDALSVAMKQLGVGADIYSGFEDSKYSGGQNEAPEKQAQTDDAPKRWECKQTKLLQPNGANYFNPTNKDGSVNNGGAKLIERLASEEAQDILDSMHEKGFKMSKDSWEWFIKQIK